MSPSRRDVEKAIEIATAFERERERENRLMDRLGPTSTPVYVKNMGRIIIVAKDMEEKERIQDYLLDMLRALLWRDPAYLTKYTGMIVEDKKGRKYELETDLPTLIRVVDESCNAMR